MESFNRVINYAKITDFDKPKDESSIIKISDLIYTVNYEEIKLAFKKIECDLRVTSHYYDIFSDENKVNLKLTTIVKTKTFGKPYFKTYKTNSVVSFNLNKGNITIIGFKTIRVNSFKKLHLFFNKLIHDTYDVYDPTLILSFDKIKKELIEHLQYKLGINKSVTLIPEGLTNQIIDWFVERKGIKVPNNYHYLLYSFYPTEKYLKSNNRKLVLSILDKLNIKSKITNKIVHTCESCDLNLLSYFCEILGEDYQKHIGNLSPLIFNNKENMFSYRNFNDFYENLNLKLISEKNLKENLILLINSYGDVKLKDILGYVNDHLRMGKKVIKYYPNITLLPKSKELFIRDHSEFSAIISKINKRYSIKHLFKDETINEIETPITINDGQRLYPFLLKREEDFIEEGTFMNHCVASYSEKMSTIIVSIRTKDGNDRITCEISKQRGEKIQARHFSNENPPSYMLEALNTLLIRTMKLARYGLLNSYETIKVPALINGVELEIKKPIPQIQYDLFPDF